ncbi:acyl carrier protein [Cellulophaga baltica]|uniref:acyl carrier protein n=1 Tax=Cellulophaga TaxID=104264 RepID=UPI001C06ADCB|nr:MULTISPECIES: acyl carrier protein [Cellulophaga]MBU2996730.1 acyl carrier protein [Cellulophaga baltica]MDO6768126.1 acyl carrier protein [Cellulophaga sp. 1_MG-2023]
MDTEQTINQLTKIFTQVLERDSIELNLNTTANDIDGWDSITHMMIINEVENELNIKFKLLDLMNLENISDLVTLIHSEQKN